MRHKLVSTLTILSLSLWSQSAAAESGFYLLGAFGKSNVGMIDRGTSSLTQNWIEGGDNGFTFGGGHQFSESISLEMAYQDFGNLTWRRELVCGEAVGVGPVCHSIEIVPKEDLKATALSVSLVGGFRITHRLGGYGRLGLSRWRFDSGNASFDGSGDDAHYGIGLRWSLDDNWTIFAEYTRLDLHLDVAIFGFRYGF